MIRANQLKVTVQKDREKAIRQKLCKQYRMKPEQLKSVLLRKLSIDARDKGEIKWVCNVDFTTDCDDQLLKKNKQLTEAVENLYTLPTKGTVALGRRPIIIGFGPAGMFAGLLLSEMGYAPIILERGESVEERTKSVTEFWETGVLNASSNVQFGEGGAGTFSDGKLTTRIKDIRCQKVLEYFVDCGAPEEITYLNKPHIGTDVLKTVVRNIRNRIIADGGEVRFNTQVTDLLVEKGQISGVRLENGDVLESDQVILAIGHSARDTFELLKERQVDISPKPFAVGVRIEHPQSIIDYAQYGEGETQDLLGAADYALTYQASNGRAVYTFCMCPGGSVVAAASETGQVVTNGMSEYARDKANANSAVLVSVTPKDFAGDDPLAGMYFQRALEEKAFELGGSNYYAPVMRVVDFLGQSSCSDKALNRMTVEPTYRPGVSSSDFSALFPEFVTEAMREGLIAFGKKIKGFDMDQGLLTAVETRTSSPIRIVRDNETLESTSATGLYPCGEGAGYAGGIISSAVDGIKCAERIIEKYQPLK
ncbi:MAG: NAD(P)/FAD-dependent oxidoreductase [Clostridia bacterium]|nr:NAD(P)/FAD-dependent oxidoreductase [Clostridia bacterium]